MRAAFNKPSKRPKREVRKFSFNDSDISDDSSCKKETSFLLFDICICIYLILISINFYIDIIYFYIAVNTSLIFEQRKGKNLQLQFSPYKTLFKNIISCLLCNRLKLLLKQVIFLMIFSILF